MKRILMFLLKSVIIFLFFSYFIVSFLVNSDRILLWTNPFGRLHLEHVTCLRSKTICLGSYPSKKLLVRLQPKTVVSLLNPKLPVSREITKREKAICKKLGIDFISLPIPFFDDTPKNYENLLALLNSPETRHPVYVHAFLFDHRLETIQHRLIVQHKTTKGAIKAPVSQ